ncbi:MAG: TraB/GumN family protein [Chitinophagaceae bacterium]|nr:TraB/GumN family protein [Chitinophagaceae bacterium]
MNRFGVVLLMSLLSITGIGHAQGDSTRTLLWKISGNGLDKPSFLFGTIHMLCKDDAVLSNNLKEAIRNADEVYFEVDLDNMFEMLGVVSKMKMRGDTTLRDLLSEDEYGRVKSFFESHSTMLPFSMLETYKPILAASLLEQNNMACDATAMMEQVIMEEARRHNKNIKGLETMGYQAGVLDKIPYKLQAEQLLRYVDDAGKKESDDAELSQMMQAYRDQDLDKLEKMITQSDPAISNYTDVLLNDRNKNWVEKLKGILPGRSLLIAVGAGHLPGKEGVISLLRKAGYKVTPVKNNMGKSVEL